VETQPRRTARVLVVDDADRLLLLCGRYPCHPPDDRRLWFTIGGGLEVEETYEQTAVREFREETGSSLVSKELGPCVWTQNVRFTVPDGRRYDQHNRYFFVRVVVGRISTEGVDRHEGVFGHRWWSLSELRSAEDPVAPRDLANLLTPLLAGHFPVEPIDLGDTDNDLNPL